MASALRANSTAPVRASTTMAASGARASATRVAGSSIISAMTIASSTRRGHVMALPEKPNIPHTLPRLSIPTAFHPAVSRNRVAIW